MRLLSFNTLVFLVTVSVLAMGCAKEESVAGESAAAQAKSADKKAHVETLVIPVGTSIVALLETPLSTKTNHTGDTFQATTTEAILVGGKTAVPSGARIQGVLQDVQASGQIEGRARMTLVYQTIVDSQGKVQTITAQPLALQAASATGGDVEKIAAGGVIGAIIGGIAGGGKGAIIGAGAGAGAGTIIMLATKGDDLDLNIGQQLAVNMTGTTSIEVPAK